MDLVKLRSWFWFFYEREVGESYKLFLAAWICFHDVVLDGFLFFVFLHFTSELEYS